MNKKATKIVTGLLGAQGKNNWDGKGRELEMTSLHSTHFTPCNKSILPLPPPVVTIAIG